MRVNKIRLADYRNYLYSNLILYPGINVLYGLNGQGKTNFIEAINYISSLKSFRGNSDEELIRNNEKGFLIEIETTIKNRLQNLKVVYNEGSKKLWVDENETKKNSEFNEIFNVLVFSPLDVTLFIDVPDRRRRFIDKELSKISPSYTFALNRFKSILKERNVILKEHGDELYLEVLTKQLGELSDFLIDKRLEFINELQGFAQIIFKNLYADENIKLTLDYQTFRKEGKSSFDYFINNLQEDRLKEKTTIGPHYDDLIVSINGLDISKYGSQGQQRLAILAMKLGLLDVYEKANEDKAVVILDDVLSELDEIKRRKIFSYFNDDYQVLITTANLEDVKYYEGKAIHCYEVSNGEIKEKNNE